jgi:predicted NBD/HSP70 family sugar kinase
MAVRTLGERVTALEAAVSGYATGRDLEAMQAALSQQILQLGNDMRLEFSAVRAEIRAGDEETRRVLREETHALVEQRTAEILALVAQGDEETRHVLREEIRAGDEETRRVLREEIRAGDEETRRVLREEIRAGDEETRAQVRTLHEDAIERIKQLGG